MFDPKAYVKSILNVTDVLNLTGEKQLHYIHALTPISPYVEYLFYDEEGAAYEEGEETATNFYLQVDIFTKTSFRLLENKIKELLLNAGFTLESCNDLYESDTSYYHKAMRFSFSVEIN